MAAHKKDPRKVPAQARSKATVDFILQAAYRIAERDGIAKLNVNSVAEVAGVSVASLYQYFPTREAIIAACEEQALANLANKFVARAQALHQARASLDSALPAIVEFAVDLFVSHARVFGVEDPADIPSRPNARLEIANAGAELLAVFLADRAEDDPRLVGKDVRLVAHLAVKSVVLIAHTSLYALLPYMDITVLKSELGQLVARYILGPRIEGPPLPEGVLADEQNPSP